MVMTSTRPRSETALDLVTFLANPENAQKALKEYNERELEALASETRAKEAQKAADASLQALQDKEGDLSQRETKLSSEQASFKEERRRANENRAKEEERLQRMADEVNARAVQNDALHKEKITSFENSIVQREEALKSRSVQVENLSKSLAKREAKAQQDQAIADAKQKEYTAKIAALREIVLKEQGA